MLPVKVEIMCKMDVIKYMLSRPMITGKVAKWSLALLEFHLQYVPQKATKGQVLADFLADHPCLDINSEILKGIKIGYVSLTPWTLQFDGSSTEDSAGAGIVLASPIGKKTHFSFKLDFKCSNNQAEYEALIIGLKILMNFKVLTVIVIGDSQLVVK